MRGNILSTSVNYSTPIDGKEIQAHKALMINTILITLLVSQNANPTFDSTAVQICSKDEVVVHRYVADLEVPTDNDYLELASYYKATGKNSNGVPMLPWIFDNLLASSWDKIRTVERISTEHRQGWLFTLCKSQKK